MSYFEKKCYGTIAQNRLIKIIVGTLPLFWFLQGKDIPINEYATIPFGIGYIQSIIQPNKIIYYEDLKNKSLAIDLKQNKFVKSGPRIIQHIINLGDKSIKQ